MKKSGKMLDKFLENEYILNDLGKENFALKIELDCP